jgi:hypothetical protein
MSFAQLLNKMKRFSASFQQMWKNIQKSRKKGLTKQK